MPPDEEPELLETRLLLEGIYARYGYDLRGYVGASMQRRLRAALAKSGLPHLGELQHRVLHDPHHFAALLEDLMVRVSDLFRDPRFYRTLRTQVFPLLRTYPLVRIWHCGCANGEEVYSHAILLEEEGLYDRVQLYATDLSPEALSHARAGVYPGERLPAYTRNYEEAGGTGRLEAYFTTAYEKLAVRASLRRNIHFFQHDLVSDQAFGEMNVVFSRNVLIYFGRELRAQVLEKFAQSLRPGGFLCLGSAEQLGQGTPRGFVPFAADDRIYRYEG